MPREQKKKILLTIDVEDWFHVENLRPWFPPEKWDAQEKRIEHNTYRILDLFDSYGTPIKGTFFVLGWIAKRFPEIIRSIHSRGHEVASHGNEHLLNNRMSERKLKQDLESSKKLLEDISGDKIVGYRAPSFSIDDKILQIVKNCGYNYDSSFNSFAKHGRYGSISTNGCQKKGIAIQLDSKFYELPISNMKILKQTIPWGGGGYFRFFPQALFQKGIKKILNKEGAYLFYMHPWEIDPNQPKVKQASGIPAWRHYLNLEKTYHRLHNLLFQFKACEFITCSKYIDL